MNINNQVILTALATRESFRSPFSIITDALQSTVASFSILVPLGNSRYFAALSPP